MTPLEFEVIKEYIEYYFTYPSTELSVPLGITIGNNPEVFINFPGMSAFLICFTGMIIWWIMVHQMIYGITPPRLDKLFKKEYFERRRDQ